MYNKYNFIIMANFSHVWQHQYGWHENIQALNYVLHWDLIWEKFKN